MNEAMPASNRDEDALKRLEEAVALAGRAQYPPVETWAPDVARDIGLRIDHNGTWYYQDSPIERQALVKLFASILRREDDGRYALVTPVEKIWIDVEDAPLLAVEMMSAGEGEGRTIVMRSNVDDYVSVDKDHPIWMENGRPYVRLRGRIDALLTRALYYDLVDIAEQREIDGPYGVWSNGHFFELGYED